MTLLVKPLGLFFNLAGFALLYALMRLQHLLPLNPQGFGAVSPDLAFNTAVSFVSNTNWQSYAGETTMSYLVQMVGFTTQNFVSAATGMALVASKSWALSISKMSLRAGCANGLPSCGAWASTP